MNSKKIAGEKAAEYIKDGMIVGLGTGSTSYYMIEKVGALVKAGMKLKAVATSKESEEHALRLHIPTFDINEVPTIDLAIDGVDEIDNQFNAIKGGGGALFREKIVASHAKEVIWIMDDGKLVKEIGNFPLPIEILPYGYRYVLEQLEKASYLPRIRKKDKEFFLTDNGNYIVDLQLKAPLNTKDIMEHVMNITGVLEVGLFLNMCDRIVVGRKDHSIKVIENKYKR